MAEFLAALIVEARALTLTEVVAVVAAIGYLLLAIRQNIWCWACAAVSTSLYIYLFFDARLYMESGLNLFYLAMAAYGWSVWRRGDGQGHERQVVVWPARQHFLAIALILVTGVVNGVLLKRYTDAAYPFIDSATTWAAIWATFLVARKVLENWWYWLVIDCVSVVIYWYRDLELTALLFVFYVTLIPFGFVSWRRSMRERAH